MSNFPKGAKFLRQVLYPITTSGVIDLKLYAPATSFTIENIGDAEITIQGVKTIAPGDPPYYVQPTEGFYRTDQFDLIFGLGANPRAILAVDQESFI